VDRHYTELPPYPIASVDNALQALQLLKEAHSLRVSDVGREFAIARSSAHRLLAMLAYRGYVRQDPETKAYVAGPALVELGLAVVRNMDVRQTARPLMERVASECGETTNLTILDGTRVLFIDGVEGTRTLRVAARTGMAMEAHCTATGKAILAQLSPEQLRELYPNDELPRMTDSSLSTLADLEAELTQVRRMGYSTNMMESEEDICAVGVALHGTGGQPVASLSVAGPASRLSRERMREIAATVKRLADDFGPITA
jgi:DNA-binding IclR family transcriptional regulator